MATRENNGDETPKPESILQRRGGMPKFLLNVGKKASSRAVRKPTAMSARTPAKKRTAK